MNRRDMLILTGSLAVGLKAMPEVADVMRDGKHIDTRPVSEIGDRSELIRLMIGKTVFEKYIPKEAPSDEGRCGSDQ